MHCNGQGENIFEFQLLVLVTISRFLNLKFSWTVLESADFQLVVLSDAATMSKRQKVFCCY